MPCASDDVETGKKHSVVSCRCLCILYSYSTQLNLYWQFKKTAESIFPGASKLVWPHNILPACITEAQWIKKSVQFWNIQYALCWRWHQGVGRRWQSPRVGKKHKFARSQGPCNCVSININIYYISYYKCRDLWAKAPVYAHYTLSGIQILGSASGLTAVGQWPGASAWSGYQVPTQTHVHTRTYMLSHSYG